MWNEKNIDQKNIPEKFRGVSLGELVAAGILVGEDLAPFSDMLFAMSMFLRMTCAYTIKCFGFTSAILQIARCNCCGPIKAIFKRDSTSF